jgi:hypothetical protein
MRRMLILVSLMISAALPVMAQEATGMKVEEMVFCTGIENRAPVGATTQFLHPIGSIYCYTKITGAADTTVVQHVWYFGEKEMARVDLPVRSSSWRTWSSKKMMTEWADLWHVDVIAEDGTVLESKEFLYKPITEEE